MPDLTHKIAVVTGSSSGIGRAAAMRLAARGASIVVHAAKNRAGAEETCAEISRLGGKAATVLCNFADAEARSKFIDSAWNVWGGVDYWVNNAGVDVLTGASKELSFAEKLQLLWQVDVESTIHLSREVGRRWIAEKREGAAIVNIGWDQSECGMEGDSGEMFATIKSAITAFSRSLARSLAPQVRVNVVAPGWIKTSWGETASDLWSRRATAEALLRRWGTPEDIAAAIEFLVSPNSGFITGHVLPVNGGLDHSHLPERDE
ncbi:SDR family NAD(P)-dependent oxidoreductase [Blastopirellula retiformator]|uniref:3-oxoacyl-[acyl-carrier-protein] reductase FabG n=1 Tax=Blastopirellula retiformator TaxID=2527970 RepID=A0A5C5V7H3_9BACT|nr:SDR family oxidoreductase [Blastopirellula retiformator]TWT34466.1 3-oxoacyl-[acyl-carrier-protein] reductase FabG [Blastopirellula retiformator]